MKEDSGNPRAKRRTLSRSLQRSLLNNVNPTSAQEEDEKKKKKKKKRSKRRYKVKVSAHIRADLNRKIHTWYKLTVKGSGDQV